MNVELGVSRNRRNQMTENRKLRRIYGIKREKRRGRSKNCIVKSSAICIPRRILLGWRNQREKMGGSRSRYGEKETCTDIFGGKTWKEKMQLGRSTRRRAEYTEYSILLIARMGTVERATSPVAMRRRCRPLYGQQSNDKKYSLY